MNSHRTATGRAMVALLSAGLLCAACTDRGLDRSGGSSPRPATVVVLAANDDGGSDRDYRNGLAGAPAVAHFVDNVAAVSRGRLTVQLADAQEAGGYELGAVQDVVAGRADLGWAAVRAFDAAGIDAFRPLQIPFLIDSYAGQAAAINDPLAGRMLASLRPHGLTGLALLAGELQYPASHDRPLQSPGDFHGRSFGVSRSPLESRALTALGAVPTALSAPFPPQTEGLDAYYSRWWLLATDSGRTPITFVTTNAPVWAHTEALIANTGRLARLSDTERAWLERAATKAAQWSVAHAPDAVSAELALACTAGVRTVLATDAQRAELRSAVEPVAAALREDPEQAAILAMIQTLVRARPGGIGEPPSTCPDAPSGPSLDPRPPALSAPGHPGDLPAGTYRYSVSEQELHGFGLNDFTAHATAGVWTWTLRGGRWDYAFKPSANDIPEGYAYATCRGWYDVDRDTVAFTTDDPASNGRCAPVTWAGRWRTTSTGLTMLMLTREGERDRLFGGKPWVRIG